MKVVCKLRCNQELIQFVFKNIAEHLDYLFTGKMNSRYRDEPDAVGFHRTYNHDEISTI